MPRRGFASLTPRTTASQPDRSHARQPPSGVGAARLDGLVAIRRPSGCPGLGEGDGGEGPGTQERRPPRPRAPSDSATPVHRTAERRHDQHQAGPSGQPGESAPRPTPTHRAAAGPDRGGAGPPAPGPPDPPHLLPDLAALRRSGGRCHERGLPRELEPRSGLTPDDTEAAFRLVRQFTQQYAAEGGSAHGLPDAPPRCRGRSQPPARSHRQDVPASLRAVATVVGRLTSRPHSADLKPWPGASPPRMGQWLRDEG